MLSSAIGVAAATLPSPVQAAVRMTAASEDDDQARRARLAARLSELRREREAAAPRARPASPARRPAQASRGVSSAEAGAPRARVAPAASAEPASTAVPAFSVQPPATVSPERARRAGGPYYTPPRLDLTTPPRIPTDDIECLTQTIYYEARNESEDGQAAVAEVVMNRSRSGAYPSSVCAVVYQRNSRTCQFTFTCDGAIGRGRVDLAKWARAERIAREVHSGRRPPTLPANSVNYHATYVSPSWGRRLEQVRQIGTHIFYSAPLGRGIGANALNVAAQAVATGLVFVRNEALDRAYEAAIQSTPTAVSAAGQP